MRNRNFFTNPNVESWFRWIFRSSDDLNAVGIYFLSKRYSTSPRHFPLYNYSKNVRIILFNGSVFPGLDRIILKFIDLFLKLTAKKFRIYKYNFIFSPKLSLKKFSNEILNFDDPEYTFDEIKNIISWETCININGYTSKIVCTTNYTRQYLLNNGSKSDIRIIPQGHSSKMTEYKRYKDRPETNLIRLVYASPYIDVEGDLHSNHVNWNASELIKNIWPKLNMHKNFQLNLIGKVGANARKLLEDTNVVLHGLVSIEDCSEILSKCDLALYPRTYDNRRQAQKVIEYIGAGLPIIGYKTVDCEIVLQEEVGILVTSRDQFVDEVLNLKDNPEVLERFKNNCMALSKNLSWINLAKEFDNLVK